MSTEVVTSTARDLTPEEREQRTQVAYSLEQTIKESIARGREAMWQLSKALYEFDQEQGWTALGYDSQGEWLAQAEIGMSKRTFHRMKSAYRDTVITRGIPMTTVEELDQTKVEIVLPAIEAGTKTIEEAFEDARTLGVRDLREVYIGPQGAPKTSEEDEGPQEKPYIGKTPLEKAAANGKLDEEGVKDLAKGMESAAHVDSWVDIGGDKRKAQRNWKKFLETYPVFTAVKTISDYMEGVVKEDGEEISKEEVKAAWGVVSTGLGLKFPDLVAG